MCPQLYQRGHSLRRLRADGADKNLIGQQQDFNLAADLRQQARGVGAAGLAEKYHLKTEAAADGFFDMRTPSIAR